MPWFVRETFDVDRHLRPHERLKSFPWNVVLVLSEEEFFRDQRLSDSVESFVDERER